MASKNKKFYVGPETTGIPGSIGEIHVGPEDDICCHLTLPKDSCWDWIFRTEPVESDPLTALAARFGRGPQEELMPTGKNGAFSISDYEGFSVPYEITLWKRSKRTIGWFSFTTNLAILVFQFAEMGKWLKSEEAKAEYSRAYGDEPAPVKKTWAQIAAGGN